MYVTVDDLKREAYRLSCAGDAPAVVSLMDAVVVSGYTTCVAWQGWKIVLMEGVVQAVRAMGVAFPDQVLRALMQYKSPEGGMFAFLRQGLGTEDCFLLGWHDPRFADGVRSIFSPQQCEPLDSFAKAWVAERARWSLERAAWVAAVVDNMKTQ